MKRMKVSRPFAALSALLLCLALLASCTAKTPSDEGGTKDPTATTEQITTTPPESTPEEPETNAPNDNNNENNNPPENTDPVSTVKNTVEYSVLINGLINVKWDENGRRVEEKGLMGRMMYEYNQNGELTQIVEEYTGNRTVWVCEINAAGQATKAVQQGDDATSEYQFTYDENGNMIKMTLSTDYFGSKVTVFSATYNEIGNVISAQNLSATYTFTYENGRVTACRATGVGESEVGTFQVEYNKDGSWKELSYYEPDENGSLYLSERETYAFDAKGNCTISMFERSGSSMEFTTSLTVDTLCRLTEWIEYGDGRIVHKLVYSYDENGNTTTEQYGLFGSERLHLVSKSVTDANGNLVEDYEFDEETWEIIAKYEYEYTEDGADITLTRVYLAEENGQLVLSEEMIYDYENGEIVSTVYEGGKIYGKTVHAWLENGGSVESVYIYDAESREFLLTEETVYNEYDDILEFTIYDYVTGAAMEKYEYTYHSDGGWTEKHYMVDENNELTLVKMLRYDANGRPV